MSDITTFILTYNEEVHIRRCVDNAFRVSREVYVIDSFSTDKTVEIAKECGAVVVQHRFINQAQQLQWALENCPIKTEWTLRLDADEYLSDKLIEEINVKITNFNGDVAGVYFRRNVKFLNHTIRFGTFRSVRLMRLWRTGRAYVEQRWMDERMVITEGRIVSFKHLFVDENLNGLTAWTNKHNNYSNREILVELDRKFHLFDEGADESLTGRNRQKSIYYRSPRFFRAFCYFFVRYICFLGFLDGVPGLIWLTLQAYWYRFLIDAKLLEMEKRLGKNPTRDSVINYVRRYFDIDVERK